MYAKPEPRATTKRRQARARQTARHACRLTVYLRDGGRCRLCGALGTDVHEIVYRSHGGSITDPDNCLLLCRDHHRAVHARTVRLP